jgi:ring-1,2-phenylacetyl-CoA epoxidase subunit PaaD
VSTVPKALRPTSPWRGEVDADAQASAAGGGESKITPPRHPRLKAGVADPPPPGEGDAALRVRAWKVAARVVDPEIPVLTIEDLGVLRDVKVDDGKVEVFITPTYSGCPAMFVIALNIEAALEDAGFGLAKITTVLSPAWSTDWLSENGKAKLKAYGIAPPTGKAGRRALFGEEMVACPRCGSSETERISEFGSTACKALWRCRACAEPFDYFKCI